jgi:uncharacterized protein YeaO (DUF488 family)
VGGRVELKRAYEPAAPTDGQRVLVERLWPRGVKKEALALDAWEKEVAPSAELRRWFGHDPARWDEFQRRYREELRRAPAAERLRALVERRRAGTLTLVFAARDEERNSAVVLKQALERLDPPPPRRRRAQAARTTSSGQRA